MSRKVAEQDTNPRVIPYNVHKIGFNPNRGDGRYEKLVVLFYTDQPKMLVVLNRAY